VFTTAKDQLSSLLQCPQCTHSGAVGNRTRVISQHLSKTSQSHT